MKVLHVINTLSAGGAELHLLTLCRHLRQRGIEIVVACLREQIKGSRPLRSDFEQEGIKVVNLRGDSRYDGRFLIRLARLLKEEEPHILHTHLPRADISAALLYRLNNLSPVFICSVHGIYRDRWFGRLLAPLMRCAYQEADGVIAISYAVKNWLAQDFQIPIEKVTVIHYGIEPEQFAYPKMDLKTTWGLKGQVVIGSVGRLEAGKGFDCLIQSMLIVRKHIPNAHLLIAGHDPWGYGKILKALIDKLELKGQVRFVGFHSDIPSFLHALDIFAFASRSEGFGQVIIEAMAAGKPVVASKIPPLTEIVVDGETGLLVEPDNPGAFADAIIRLMNHPDAARQRGEAGAQRVRKDFSAYAMAERTLDLYNRFVSLQ